MLKSPSKEKRLPWSTPQLLRIKAGSAEGKDNAGLDDGGKGSTDKS